MVILALYKGLEMGYLLVCVFEHSMECIFFILYCRD